MSIKCDNKRTKNKQIAKIFGISAVFFAGCSMLGPYSFTVYSEEGLILFYLYELIFFLGLIAPEFTFIRKCSHTQKERLDKTFVITRTGYYILCILCAITVLLFLYFMYSYNNKVGSFSFGAFTAAEFSKRKDFFDKISMFLIQAGGDASFLILAQDHTNRFKRLKILSHVTLFLPGLCYLLMGSRFLIAVEFFLLFFSKWHLINRRTKYIVISLGLVLAGCFLYLFSSRAYYVATERYLVSFGDMEMKMFWRAIYDLTNGGIDVICLFFDYVSQPPYTFAYLYEFKLPEEIYMGRFSFRSIYQILDHIFSDGKAYLAMASKVFIGRYSGFPFELIVDYGMVGSFFATFFVGKTLRMIERNVYNQKLCSIIYPAVETICFFAPIVFFYVGRIDFTIFFCTVFGPFCVKEEFVKTYSPYRYNSEVLIKEL